MEPTGTRHPRASYLLALVTLLLLTASIVLAVTTGHVHFDAPTSCNASCYR